MKRTLLMLTAVIALFILIRLVLNPSDTKDTPAPVPPGPDVESTPLAPVVPPSPAVSPPVEDRDPPPSVPPPATPAPPSAPTAPPPGSIADRPPGHLDEQTEPTLAGEVDAFIAAMKAEGGPEQYDRARDMLKSEQPLVQAAGAAVLAEAGLLAESDMQQVAGDLAVGLEFLGWLRDRGDAEYALQLEVLLTEAGLDNATLTNLLEAGVIRAAGGRAALDLLQNTLPAEEQTALYQTLAGAEAQDYTVRMQALWRLRSQLPFETYREQVGALALEADRGDAVWNEGLTRLDQSLQGPLPVLDRPPLLAPQGIDGLFARPYPMMLEDAVLAVEYTVQHDNGQVVQGTADRLLSYVSSLQQDPLSSEQHTALLRLQRLTESLEVMEGQGPPLLFDPDLPPGAGK